MCIRDSMMTALHVELASPVIIPYSTITHTETIPGITFEPLILLSSLNNVIPIIAMWTPVWGFTLSFIDGITSYYKGIVSIQR